MAHHHRVRTQAAHIGDEASQVPSDLRIGWDIVLHGGRHGLYRAKLIDLHDIGCDAALHRLPCERSAEAERQPQPTKGHQPPVSGLNPRRSDPVVPHLRGPLVGRGGLGGQAVALYRASEHGQASF